MQHIFLTKPAVISPRWQQAFSGMRMVVDAAFLPQNMRDTLLWVVVDDVSSTQDFSRWIAAGARIIALTQTEDPRQAKQVLESGASGYLHYLAVTPVLEQVSQVVQLGGLWLGADLMRQLVLATANVLAKDTTGNAESPLLALLSQRERDVAEAVAAGKNNKEVARDLNITERTVKAHLSAVFDKLKVRDRLHLVLVLAGK